MRWNILILSFTLSLTPLALSAAVYKWTDESGNTHYSQSRPADAKSKRMNIAPPPREDFSTYKKPSLNKKEGADDQSNKTAANDGPAGKKKSKGNDPGCKAAKSNLKKLLSSGRSRTKDKDGNVSYMSDEQKQQRLKQERDFIAKNCK